MICRFYEGCVQYTIQYYQLEAQYNYHVSVSAPARRSRAPRGPIAFVAFVATASLLAAAAAVTSSSGTVVFPAPLPPRGVAVVFLGGRGGIVVVVVIRVRAPHVVKETPGFFAVRMGPAMSFPSGDVVVTPFVGADDENDSTVVPPQGSDFFEDVYDGDYFDGLQNKDGEDCIAPGSAVLRPRQTWGGA